MTCGATLPTATRSTSRLLDASERALIRLAAEPILEQQSERKAEMLQRERVLWLVLVCALLLMGGCATSPPVQEMSDARQAIAAAEDAEAARLAPDALREAHRFLAQAEQHLQQEAYGLARLNATRAKDRAMQALAASQNAAGDTRND